MIAAAPAIYYVSASAGADTNPGTMAAPWQHLAAAVARMKSGDLLYLKMGDTWPTGDCIRVSADAETFATYGTGALPTFGQGCKLGIDNEGFNDLTVQGLHITGTTAQGIFSIALKDGQNLRGRILSTTIDNTGDSAINVKGRGAIGQAPIIGWDIENNVIGKINHKVGLNYDLAGIQLQGLSGAMVKNNQVATVTAMGIQDRPQRSWNSLADLKAACSGNVITKGRVWNNEGNITAVCYGDEVSRNYIHDSRGFGIQPGPYGNVYLNNIIHLKTSTDGLLYNGIDGNGAPYVKLSDNTITDVPACSMTFEGTGIYAAVGAKVSGGTVDATGGGNCALYVTASSNPVTFDGKTKWITSGHSFKVGGLAWANMMDQATFLQKTSVPGAVPK